MSAESPATPTKNADGTRKPTEKEAMFFFNILGSMKNKPDVSMQTVFSSVCCLDLPLFSSKSRDRYIL